MHRCTAVSGRVIRVASILCIVCSICAVGMLGCVGAPQPPSASAADARLAQQRSDVPKASALVKQAEQKLQEGDGAGAQTLLEQAIAADPSDARAQFELGVAREMQQDAAGAEAAYRAAIAIQGDMAEALSNLGAVLREEGDLQRALPFLRRAAEANPGSESAHMNLALAYEDVGDAPAARAAYGRHLDIKPDDALTRANLGLLLLAMQQRDEALPHLRQAMRSAKGSRPALWAIGNGLRRAGEPQLAVEAMQAAVKAGGAAPTPALLAELGVAQRAAGDRDAAIATLGRALELDAKYATAHFMLGSFHAGAARWEEARKHLEAYLKLEPDGPHAARAKKKLSQLPK